MTSLTRMMNAHDGNNNKSTYTNPHKHPFTMTYPSLYEMVHNINSITIITIILYLFVMEPHIPTLCMMMMMMMMMTTNMIVQTMSMHTHIMVTPLIWTIPLSDYNLNRASKLYRNRKERIDTHKKYTQATPQATPKASSQQKHPSKNTHRKKSRFFKVFKSTW